MKLPFFPLQSVFFPGETVPLHIFEERYKQLINDCKNESITFGIPVFIYDSIAFGTEVQLVDVVTTYENGEMDVVCVARQVFKVLTFDNEMPGKKYSGGVIEFLDVDNHADVKDRLEVMDKIGELYGIMGMPYTPMPQEKFNSYILAHKIGLTLDQEFQLLQIIKESERLAFLKLHLINIIKVLNAVDRTKKTIKLNGDFRNFDPLDFKDVEIQQ